MSIVRLSGVCRIWCLDVKGVSKSIFGQVKGSNVPIVSIFHSLVTKIDVNSQTLTVCIFQKIGVLKVQLFCILF